MAEPLHALSPVLGGPALTVTASTPEMVISPPVTASKAEYFGATAGKGSERSSSVSESSSSAASTALTEPSSDSKSPTDPSLSPPKAAPLKTRTSELAKPALKRPPSLTELTRAMRLDPARWEKLKMETDQARAADEAAAAGGSTSRLRLQVSSLQRGGEGRVSSPVSGPSSTLPLVGSAAPNGGEGAGARPTLGKTMGRMPSLADIQQRVMARSKSHDGSSQLQGDAKRTDESSSASGEGPLSPNKTAAKLPSPILTVSEFSEPLGEAAQEEAMSAPSTSSPSPTKASIPAVVLSTSESTPISPATASSTLHPLQHSWTLFFDSKATAAAGKRAVSAAKESGEPPTPTVPMTPGGTPLGAHGQAYQAALQTIGTFSTVEDFCRYFNWTKRPSQLDMHSSVQMFKDGIKPMWEDAANAEGGKWTVTMKVPSASLLDRLWTYLVLALVGEEVDLHDDVCGATVATRPRGNRIQVWTREKNNVEKINGLGKRLIKVLELKEDSGVAFDFSPHSGGAFAHSGKFISIVGAVPTPSRPSMPGHSFSTNSVGSPLRSGSTSSPLTINTSQPVVPFPAHLEGLVSPQRRVSVGVDMLNFRRPSMEQLSAIAQQQRRASVEAGPARPPLLVHHSHHMGMSVPPGMQAVIVPGPPPPLPGQPGSSGAGPLTGTWRPGLMGVGAPPLPPHLGAMPKRANSFAEPSGGSNGSHATAILAPLQPSLSRGPSPSTSPSGRNAPLPPALGLGIDTTGGGQAS